MRSPKKKPIKKQIKTTTSTATKTATPKSPAPKAPTQSTMITVECSKLEKALLLFAFHESAKAQYLIRMAQSGANVNPTAAMQRISGLKTYYNSRLEAMKEVYDSVSSSSSKTKRIEPGIDDALTIYYTGNTNSEVPVGYTWPVAI